MGTSRRRDSFGSHTRIVDSFYPTTTIAKPPAVVRAAGQGFNGAEQEGALMELRPLGFGEIFDRAVTLYIRNFVPFAAIVMVLVLPLAILQYYLDRAAQPQFDAILKILTNPGHTAPPNIPNMYESPATIVLMVVTVLWCI